jgi:hypothetical protein
MSGVSGVWKNKTLHTFIGFFVSLTMLFYLQREYNAYRQAYELRERHMKQRS